PTEGRPYNEGLVDLAQQSRNEMTSMKKLVRFALYVSCLLLPAGVAVAQELQFATLGDFQLESGEVIRDCRIGYRTFGRLNATRTNAVLFTTWSSGTSEQLKSNIGSGRVVDDSRYYVVAVDALGNGVSSSPSNSKLQPRMQFPKFTISDMVRTQYEVLTKVLGLSHLRAVVGMSMGGMQAFQWSVSCPDFMDQVIPIVGSPQLAPYDLLHWQTQIDAIMNDRGWNNGNYSENPARAAEAEFSALLLTTPQNYNKRMTRSLVFSDLEKAKKESLFDANDKIRQDQAMMGLDVTARFGGSMERAAAAVKAKVFVIVATADHVVTPGPAMEFARLQHSKLLILESDCGHQAPSCESKQVNQAVSDFFSTN
ncbi:MAG: alpha/beta fold hydrolase, partial [Pyrinomonadaceae bacterium]|nr:alpha/beta fold hydrolase [Pyrinomonadaceae bacterium]